MANVLLSPSTGGGAPDPTDPEAIARVLLEKSSLLIYITDLNYKVVLFNRAAREATGYDTAACPNVHALLERFYPDPGYRSIVQGIHDGWAKNEHIRGTELVVQCKDGSQRTISWSTSRLKVGRRSSSGYIAMGVDVTTRRSLEQWVSLLQRSLQHLTEGVVLTDPSGHILAWSEGAHRLLGHEESGMQGRSLSDLYLRAERAIIARSVERAIEADGRFTGELELEQADGGSRIVGFQQVRLDGEGGLPLALLTVLSEPESAGGRAPAEALTELEGKIGELTAALAAEQTATAEQAALVAMLLADASAAGGAPAAENPDQAARITALEAEVTAARADVQRLQAEAEATAQAAAGAAGEADAAAAAAKKAADEAGKAADEASEAVGAEKKRADDAEAALEVAKKAATDAAAKAEAAEAKAAAAEKKAEEAATAAKKAGDDLAAAQSAVEEQTKRAERLEGRIQAADLVAKSASGKVDAAEAKTAKAESDVAAAKADVEKANAAVAEAEAAAAELQKKLAELEGKGAEAQASAADSVKAAEEKTAAAEKKVEEAEAALVKAEAAAADEQGRREESHRAALKEIQERAAQERKTLEDQLSTDILAAEERAETEREKLEARFAQEKAELEQAAVIARAEAESEWRDRVAALEAQLAKVPPLQGYLTQVARDAFVAADAEGRIIGWSAGAAELDGREASAALGKHLHKDVLTLDGVDWKKLFGKVVVAGRVEGDYTLVHGGTSREVRVTASLVRDADGRIQGVAESLRALQPEGGLDLHGRAAFAEVAAPLYQTIEDRVAAGLAAHRRSASSTQDLLRVAKGVAEGVSAAELEALARDLDLSGLLEAGPDGLKADEKAWRALRATVQDLTRITTGVARGGTLQVRWNELVERCLSVVEAAPAAPKTAERVFGDRISAELRGEFVVPLLLALFASPTPKNKTPAVATSTEGDTVRLDSRGPTPTTETKVLLQALAEAAGGRVTVGHDGKATTASIVLPRYPVVEATAVEADASDDIPELELEAMPDEDEEAEATSVGSLALPGIDDAPVAEDASPAVLASGSAAAVEEDDGGDLLLMLGEDSAVLRKAPESEVEYVPVSATGNHPRVDGGIENTDAELEGAYAGDANVSASVRQAADEMDAFAAKKGKGDDISDLQTGPMSAAKGPSPEVLREMQATNPGEGKGEKPAKGKGKKSKGKKKKKSKGKAKK